MRHWPIAGKIGLSLVILVMIALAVGLEGLRAMNSYGDAVVAMEHAARRATLGERINGHVLAVVMDSRGIYMSETTAQADKFAKPLLARLDNLRTDLERWRELAPTDQTAQYGAAQQAAEQFITFRRELVRLAREVSPAEARAFGDNDANRQNRQALNAALESLAARNADAVSALVARTEHVYRQSLIINSTMLVVGLTLGLGLVMLMVHRQVVGPLRSLTASLRRLADGDLDAPIPVAAGRDEIGAMAEALEVLKHNEQDARGLRAAQEEQRAAAEHEKIAALRAMADTVEGDTSSALDRVAGQTAQMAGQAETMAQSALAVTANAQSVAAAAAQALSNAQSVAGALQELNASAGEINRQVTGAADESAQAVSAAEDAQAVMSRLVESAARIGEVSRMIRDIASRTQMLALNATIEASRAGEAGKGFAVVAEEVKSLANQTAAATETIGQQIEEIQADTQGAAHSVGDVSESIRRLGVMSSGIAAAMEEQGAATQEIARNITQTATAAQEVSSRISEVSRDAGQTGDSAEEVRASSRALADSMKVLRQSLVRTVRTATGDVDRRTVKRAVIHQQCELEVGGQCSTCTLVDICEQGAALEAHDLHLSPGQPVRLKLANSNEALEAEVNGCDDDRIRVTFHGRAAALARQAAE